MSKQQDLMCSIPDVSTIELKEFEVILRSTNHPTALSVADNVKLLKVAVTLVKGVTEISSGKPDKLISGYSGLISGVTSGAAVLGKNIDATRAEKPMKMTAFVAGTLAKTLSLAKVGGMSPAAASATIAVVFTEKTLLAFGVAAETDRQKLYVSYASVVAAVAGLGVTIATGGALPITLATLSLAAQMVDAYGQKQKAADAAKAGAAK